MYVCIYMNEYCWPEVIGVYQNYDQAEGMVLNEIAASEKDLVSRGKTKSGVGGVTEIEQEQFCTGPESYHSYIIQLI